MNTFKWLLMAFCWLLVIPPYFLTKLNGTYSRYEGMKLKQPFNEHGEDFYGDPTTVVPVLCLIIYHMQPCFNYLHPIWLAIGLYSGWIAHRDWWKGEPGHMMPDRTRSGGDPEKWYLDHSISGWLNLLLITMTVALLLEYVFRTHPPWYIVIAIGVLFFIFNIIGIISYKYAAARIDNVIVYSKTQEMVIRFTLVIVITAIKLLW